MNITSNTILFYEIALISFLIIFKIFKSFNILEHDSSDRRHIIKHLIISLSIFLITITTIYAFNEISGIKIFNYNLAIVTAIMVSMIPVTFVRENQKISSAKNISYDSRMKHLKNIPDKKINLDKHELDLRKKNIEEHTNLFLIVLSYVILFILINLLNYNIESIINGIIKFITAISIGVLFGIVLTSLKKKNVTIFLTIATCSFLIGDITSNMGIISVLSCAILYHGIMKHNVHNISRDKTSENKNNNSENEMKYFEGIVSIGYVLICLGIIFKTGLALNIPAIIIGSMIILLRLFSTEKRMTISILPIFAILCLERIFPGLESGTTLIFTITSYLIIYSTIINIKDLIKKVKKIFYFN